MNLEQSINTAAALDFAQMCEEMLGLSPLPVAALEGPGHIVCYINHAFGVIMGKSKEQLIGKPFCAITPLSNDCVGLLDRVHCTGVSAMHTEHELSRPLPAFWSYTLWPVMADKRTRGIVIQVTETTAFHEKMLAMNEALVLGSVRQDELIEAAAVSNAQLQKEIIARQETEQVLQQAQAQLADRAGQLESAVAQRTSELTATNKQLDAFVYSIAHDLRAPLRSMQGFSSMLVADPGSALSETGKDFANRINLSAQFMDALLQDLLAFSRVAKENIQLTSMEVEPIVKSVVLRMEALLEKTHAEVEIAGQWWPVLAHGPTLGQVLTNLISNALKFVPSGLVPRVRLRMEEKGKFNRIWVEDNGVGVPPDQREKIFRLFTRLNGEKFPGTGIGLAIVEKGVERMSGSVGLESEPGKGSGFWFELKKG